MNEISFSEYKKRQLEIFWNDVDVKGIEQEMKMFQAQYDDGKNHSIEVWDKWYDELLEYLEPMK